MRFDFFINSIVYPKINQNTLINNFFLFFLLFSAPSHPSPTNVDAIVQENNMRDHVNGNQEEDKVSCRTFEFI